MKKFYFKVLFFFLLAANMQSQCTPAVAGNPITGCAPLQVILNCPNVSQGNAVWTIGSASYTGVTTSVIIPAPGIYVVTLTVTFTTPTLCVGTNTLLINVVTGPKNGCATTVTGLGEFNSGSDLVIYPNPNNGAFNLITGDDMQGATMVLMNLLGHVVHETCLQAGENAIKVHSNMKGLYTLSVYQNNTPNGSRKVVIE